MHYQGRRFKYQRWTQVPKSHINEWIAFFTQDLNLTGTEFTFKEFLTTVASKETCLVCFEVEEFQETPWVCQSAALGLVKDTPLGKLLYSTAQDHNDSR